MRTFDGMKRAFLFLLLLAACGVSRAQTVIDLKRGGTVRAKTIDDYKQENRFAEREAADSVAYQDCLTRAFNALHADSLQQAGELFERALKLRPYAPGNHIVRYNLGRIGLARGDYRTAVACFTAVLKLHPEDEQARLDRATAYLELGNAADALSDCNALLAMPIDRERRKTVLFLRAAAYMKNRLYRAARTDLEEVMRLEPDNENAPLLLAVAYEKDGQPQEALGRLNLYVNAHPDGADGLVMRAGMEERLGMDDAARADYDAALRLEPSNADLYVARAAVLVRLGAKGVARRDLEQAVRLGHPRAALQKEFGELSRQ